MITRYDIPKHITVVSNSSWFEKEMSYPDHSSVSSHLSIKFGRNKEYEVENTIDQKKEEEEVLSKKYKNRKLGVRVNL